MNDTDQKTQTGEARLIPQPCSASAAPEELREAIAEIIRDAFKCGFDAESADALDFFDGFVFANDAIDQHWPNASDRHRAQEPQETEL